MKKTTSLNLNSNKLFFKTLSPAEWMREVLLKKEMPEEDRASITRIYHALFESMTEDISIEDIGALYERMSEVPDDEAPITTIIAIMYALDDLGVLDSLLENENAKSF